MDKIFRSEGALFKQFCHFVESHETITLLSAYVKRKALEDLNAARHIRRIVVRWDLADLLGPSPASDLDVYEYCIANEIELFRNPRLHMKVLWNHNDTALIGSSNVTERGLGRAAVYNFEASYCVMDLSINDNLYFERMTMAQGAHRVTRTFYDEACSLVERLNRDEAYQRLAAAEVLSFSSDEAFCTSKLPRFCPVEKLFDLCQVVDSLSRNHREQILHDLAVYDVSLTLSKDEFYRSLAESFFSEPFIAAFLSAVKRAHIRRPEVRPSFGFTESTIWFATNSAVIPTVKRWELKESVSAVFEWVDFLSNGDFSVERPRHAQVLYYNKKIHT